MKILFVSNLFPDAEQPVRGLANATLLHNLHSEFGVTVRAISPRSAFPPPLQSKRLSPAQARAFDLSFQPAFPKVGYIPRIGSRWNDRLMARSLRPWLLEAIQDFRPDVILGSWLYPDGCAISRICRRSEVPVVLISQGTDTHHYLSDPVRRRKIVSAIKETRAVICRSADLGDRLRDCGVPPERIRVIYNGVDPEIFLPRNKLETRRDLGVDESSPVLLFVGNLLPVKNPLLLIRSHANLNDRRMKAGLAPAILKLIGEGPLLEQVTRESERLGSRETVTHLGRMTSLQIAKWMAASDILCLTSRNEGFPNVILEALACGLPVVSTDVGGIKEKIPGLPYGLLVRDDDPKSFAAALESILASRPCPLPPSDLSWRSSAAQYLDVLKSEIS